MKTIERAHSPRNLWEKIKVRHAGRLGPVVCGRPSVAASAPRRRLSFCLPAAPSCPRTTPTPWRL
eukprot:12728532-Prorocentrum_lima.AAC.1